LPATLATEDQYKEKYFAQVRVTQSFVDIWAFENDHIFPCLKAYKLVSETVENIVGIFEQIETRSRIGQ
jgi:hypothetical protein